MTKRRFFDEGELPISSGMLPCDYPDMEKRGIDPLPIRDLRALDPASFVDNVPLNIPGTPPAYSGYGSIKVPTDIIDLSSVPSPTPPPVPKPPLKTLTAATVTRESGLDLTLTAGPDYKGLAIEVFPAEGDEDEFVNLVVLSKNTTNNRMQLEGTRIAVTTYVDGRYDDLTLRDDDGVILSRGDAVATAKGRIKVLMPASSGTGTILADFREKDGRQTRAVSLRRFNDKTFSGLCLLDRYSDMFGMLEGTVGSSEVIMTGMFGGGTTPTPNFTLKINQLGASGESYTGLGYDVKNELLYALDAGNGKVLVWQFRPPGNGVAGIAHRYSNRDFTYTPVSGQSNGIAAYNNLIYIQNGNNVEVWSTT